MMSVTNWVAFIGTLVLVLLPDDTSAMIHLTLKIMMASLVGFIVWQTRTVKRYQSGLRSSYLNIGSAIVAFFAGGLFLYFDQLLLIPQAGIAAALGGLSIWSTYEWLRHREPYQDGANVRIYNILFVGGWIGFVAAIGAAVILGKMTNLAQAGGIILLGTIALCFSLLTFTGLARGQPFQVEGHWGGLGGGLGGWRVSHPVVFLVLALFFSGATATLVLGVEELPNPGLTTPQNSPDMSEDSKQSPSTVNADAKSSAPQLRR